MLSKYYYQAVGVWVVFFLPGSDADDTELYNQFMHSLKKVLKVPGSTLIISGVILRLDCSGIPLYGNTSNSYNLEMRLFDPLSTMPVGSLPPEQLAQQAASLHEQQRQSGRSSLNASALGNPRQNNRFDRPENNRVNCEPSTSQFGQVQQLQKQQQISNVPQMSQMMVQREPERGGNGNQQLAGSSSQSQEDAEGDPEKRLQATLQLVADLLKQIQKEKGT